MKIAIITGDYPPAGTDGITRHKEHLARALAALDQEIHVVTFGEGGDHVVDGVHVHAMPFDETEPELCPDHPSLNRPFQASLQLLRRLLLLHDKHRFDIANAPLWLMECLATVEFFPGPVVVDVQTTLLQIIELQRRQPRPHEEIVAAADRRALLNADGILADSLSIVGEINRLYGVPIQDRPHAVVHLGIPDLPNGAADWYRGKEILVIGRLEQRKGTQFIFDIAEDILALDNQLTIRFIGRDNSAGDGFFKQNGLTYPEFFAERHGKLSNRVFFEGYVDDGRLYKAIATAMCVLHLSYFESFGLTYVEAMRGAAPVIAFGHGGAVEIFASGEGDGGILVERENASQTVEAIARLLSKPKFRDKVGRAGRERYLSAFTDRAMAKGTLDFFREIVRMRSKPHPLAGKRRIYQVMEALGEKDAVASITTGNAPVIASLGGEEKIVALFAAESMRPLTMDIRALVPRSGDCYIIHYWIYNWSIGIIRNLKGPRAVYYHNITPPRFFPPSSNAHEMCLRAYNQLPRIADEFDLIIGDSEFNVKQFAKFLSIPKPTLPVYPVIDVAAMKKALLDRKLSERLRNESDLNILFVGRIAPNKNQERLMRFFDYFRRETGRDCSLHLVGNTTNVPEYFGKLEQLRDELPTGEFISFPGSVSEEQLTAYYRSADVLLCASEHEGFCIPLAEAMAYDVPVIALAKAAVPETMGDSGILIDEWDEKHIAEAISRLSKDKAYRDNIVAAQRSNLKRFSAEAREAALRAAVEYLHDGIEHPSFVWRGGGKE